MRRFGAHAFKADALEFRSSAANNPPSLELSTQETGIASKKTALEACRGPELHIVGAGQANHVRLVVIADMHSCIMFMRTCLCLHIHVCMSVRK